ncbi:MAG: hypothetical protein ACRDHL_02135 [Candidatus Promineifilaceae bacterium]
MASPPALVQLLCRQCSAPLPVEQGTAYVVCEYCGTTNVVEKGQTVFHYALRPTLRPDDAAAALRRWMAGNETVKGLDTQAQIEPPEYQSFPMWLVRADQAGREQVYLEPAAAISIAGLKELTVPAADLEAHDPADDPAAVEATVPYKAMLEWLARDHGVDQGQINEAALLQVPLYQFKYSYAGRRYTALVDAAAGRVFAAIFPSKWEAPYRAIGAAAFVLYLLAALIPVGAELIGLGLGLGIVLYLLAAAGLALPIFSAAAAVSARV